MAGCSIPDCLNKHCARRFCKVHYYGLYRKDGFELIQPHNKIRLPCKYIACNRLSHSRGYCLRHYKRYRRNTLDNGDAFQILVHPPIDKLLWTDANIAWIAGIIEGEGNFDIRSSKACRIRVRMTDFDVIYKLQDITKIGIINGPYKRKNPKHKPSLEWVVNKKYQFVELSRAIYPWLLLRRKTKLESIFNTMGEKLCP